MKLLLYIVGCRGVVQLGGADLGFAREGPTKVGACKSILFTGGSCVVEISFILFFHVYNVFSLIKAKA